MPLRAWLRVLGDTLWDHRWTLVKIGIGSCIGAGVLYLLQQYASSKDEEEREEDTRRTPGRGLHFVPPGLSSLAVASPLLSENEKSSKREGDRRFQPPSLGSWMDASKRRSDEIRSSEFVPNIGSQRGRWSVGEKDATAQKDENEEEERENISMSMTRSTARIEREGSWKSSYRSHGTDDRFGWTPLMEGNQDGGWRWRSRSVEEEDEGGGDEDEEDDSTNTNSSRHKNANPDCDVDIEQDIALQFAEEKGYEGYDVLHSQRLRPSKEEVKSLSFFSRTWEWLRSLFVGRHRVPRHLIRSEKHLSPHSQRVEENDEEREIHVGDVGVKHESIHGAKWSPSAFSTSSEGRNRHLWHKDTLLLETRSTTEEKTSSSDLRGMQRRRSASDLAGAPPVLTSECTRGNAPTEDDNRTASPLSVAVSSTESPDASVYHFEWVSVVDDNIGFSFQVPSHWSRSEIVVRPSGRRLFLARFIHFVISDERGSNPRIDIIFERTDGFHKFNVDSEWEEVSNGRDVTFDKSSMQKISLTSCPAEGFVVSSDPSSSMAFMIVMLLVTPTARCCIEYHSPVAYRREFRQDEEIFHRLLETLYIRDDSPLDSGSETSSLSSSFESF